VCVALVGTKSVTLYKATGSYLDLTVNYSKDDLSSVEWLFNGERFAEYSKSQAYSFRELQFTGRLKENTDQVGVTVQDLQLQDLGEFTVVIDGVQGQHPTEEFIVYIQSPITSVQIEKKWKVFTNSCDVDVKCAALGAESVSYQWSGYKNMSGAQLQFSLSTEEEDVALNCNASNNVSSIIATETLSCSTDKLDTGKLSSLMWIAIAGGTSAFLLFAIIAAISYWWRFCKGASVAECTATTVYADINNGATANRDRRADSVTNGMSVYETVDDQRMNPET
ncbi:SLAM family member 8-like, partial [Clarias magur]